MITFEDRVAVVTGAGGGLGRTHALALAARGVAVVVNDIGGAADGKGGPGTAAQAVVDEIVDAGGVAVADAHSVDTPEGGAAIVATAIEAFGHLDIVVNNAGILRDKAFHGLEPELVKPVIAVHLLGAFNVTIPAWRHFRERRHGRVINTTSGAGILGNFGQANYAAAKTGLLGLTNVLAIEGERYGITANAIAPVARTPMTEGLLGRLADRVDPGLVSPVVVWLASDECTATGRVYTVGGGRVARFFVGMTEGWARTDGELLAEDVERHWDQINDTTSASVPTALADDFGALKRALDPQGART